MLARLPLCLLVLLSVDPVLAQVQLSPRSPASVGCDGDALQAAAARIEAFVESEGARGAVVLVARGDAIVLHEAYGFRDPAGEKPMRRDTLFRMASNTKAVTAAAIMKLVEQGKVALDDPAKRWFPSFADGAAADITVQHLLTHTSGFTINSLFVRPLMKPSAEHPDAPKLVLECARFGEIGPSVKPGTKYSYSNPGYNTLAGIVTLAGDAEFEAWCRAELYDPIGMVDAGNHEDRVDRGRMSDVMRRRTDGSWRATWSTKAPATLPFVRGSGGMIATAVDYAKFARVFLTGGLAGKRRVLSEDSVAAMTRNQIPHIEGRRYGFGWVISKDGSFSHTGSDGTMVWCDPARDVVAMVLTQTQGSKGLAKVRSGFRAAVTAACPVATPGGR